ncbi:hypothetical protein FOMPIDRAFT_1165054 [Fomitopsis schrenkii]|uniref:Epoxide hydrolase N-terminal domain-containing protein n=1 Tax=Fomitopsis schrenkii TaxID=2126942 RepID=S8FJW2_FOMSC|nr:hypothetical protein FOMPIDRAFT_1165054 [Fomitopsis schrenkii]
MAEQPFTIAVPDSDLDLLHRKLDLVRFPDELDGAGWDYGAPLADIKRLVARWKDGFNWRAAEAGTNEIPHFTRDIKVDGFSALNIHYVHQKSVVKNAVPLLFLHGWPGSFLEVRKMLPLLTAASPDHPSFHVVAPSLPNFGFSEPVKERGFHGEHYAEVAHKLMLALGYDEYVVQGGDWGSFIAATLAGKYGHKSVKAWHTNCPWVRAPPALTQFPRLWLQHLLTPYTPNERAGLARMGWFQQKGQGYFMEHATQPQTIGYSLADSPVGLLAWIYEKLVAWSDNYTYEDDEVLEWVSVYWFSRAGPAASIRIYYEVANASQRSTDLWSPIPCGISFFPQELSSPPRTWARTIGNVVFEAEHGAGGHFAAHERPEDLAADVRAMFGKGGPAFGVVPGSSGYD